LFLGAKSIILNRQNTAEFSMKTTWGFTFLLGLVLGMGDGNLNAQNGFGERRDRMDSPFAPSVQIFYKPSTSLDSTRVVVYSVISQSMLRYVLSGSRYAAAFEMTISFKNDKGELVGEKIFQKRIVADSSRNADPSGVRQTMEMNLIPGAYTMFMEFLDLETRIPQHRKETIQVPDFFSKPFSATDILFFNQPGDSAFPVLTQTRVMTDSQFYALFYLAQKNPPQTVRFRRWVINSAGDTSLTDSASVYLSSFITPLILPLSQPFPFGRYTMDVLASDGQNSIRFGKTFFVHWKSHSESLTQFDQAVEVVAELIHPPELNGYEKMTPEQQKRAYEEFWKKRDPTPETEDNELEIEFFQRVASANQNFSQYRQTLKGWQTDRGRIFILNGQPDEIERPTMATASMKSYELWYYRTLNRRYIFEDRMGDGNYRLIGQE
jgi:GWxTD domain-containing protein